MSTMNTAESSALKDHAVLLPGRIAPSSSRAAGRDDLPGPPDIGRHGRGSRLPRGRLLGQRRRPGRRDDGPVESEQALAAGFAGAHGRRDIGYDERESRPREVCRLVPAAGVRRNPSRGRRRLGGRARLGPGTRPRATQVFADGLTLADSRLRDLRRDARPHAVISACRCLRGYPVIRWPTSIRWPSGSRM